MVHPTVPAGQLDVILLRPGVGKQTFRLDPGATVGDLLRWAGADLRHRYAFLGGHEAGEADPLRSGDVVCLVPRVRNGLVDLLDEAIEPTRMTVDELRQEVAIHLFRIEKLTMGQASRLAGLDRLRFQHLLASRDIPIHYDVADFEDDLEALRELGRV